MKRSEDIKELAAALSKAQAEMGKAKKSKKNPFFNSDYADLEAVWDACREPLTKNGLSIIQVPDFNDKGEMVLETSLMHSSGQWVTGQYPIRPVKADPQSLGSAITYARRNSVGPMSGVVVTNEDDDGEHAMARDKEPERPHPRPVKQAAPPVQATLPDTQLPSEEALRKRSVEFWKMVHYKAYWSNDDVLTKMKDLFKKDKTELLTSEEFGVLWGVIETNPKEKPHGK